MQCGLFVFAGLFAIIINCDIFYGGLLNEFKNFTGGYRDGNFIVCRNCC